ncbi:MAG: ArsR family transcriptional regulator [Nitrososphaerota archaeon]|nr:ArsR family transcriptional regulator [Candidatus Calditenuaceae archaeon]MDW8072713.1 ArsR family transcriptional regulator [Nitrososphaerota archaeon]
MKRLPKGSSEPIILKSLVSGTRTIRDIERATKLKKPTLYLSLNKMKKKGLIKPLGTRRSRKWVLTRKGKEVISRRLAAEKILKDVVAPLKRVVSLGVSFREIERLISRR